MGTSGKLTFSSGAAQVLPVAFLNAPRKGDSKMADPKTVSNRPGVSLHSSVDIRCHLSDVSY